MVTTRGRTDGLTHQEGLTMDHLVEAWNRYADLPTQHEDDLAEFLTAIHQAQHILAIRVARRCYPEGWAQDA